MKDIINFHQLGAKLSSLSLSYACTSLSPRAYPYPSMLYPLSLSLKQLPSPLCSASGGEGFSDGRIQNSRGFGDGGICYNGSMGDSAAAGSSAVAVRGFAGGRIQSSGSVGASTIAGSRAAAAWGLWQWWDPEQWQCKGLWWRQDSEQRQCLRGVR
jgi:hypothetical protein